MKLFMCPSCYSRSYNPYLTSLIAIYDVNTQIFYHDVFRLAFGLNVCSQQRALLCEGLKTEKLKWDS